MSRTKWYAKPIYVMVALALVLSLGIMAVPAVAATTINVPLDYPTIQAAIDAASDGATIIVAAGIYEETVSIKDKSLTLLGAQADEPIVNGERAGDESIIRGKLDWRDRPSTYCLVRIQHSDVVINGFSIENAKQWNIGIQGHPEAISNILISYNYIVGDSVYHKDGIFRDNAAADVTIDHNYIASNSRGIATNGGATTVTDNTFYHNGQGIAFMGIDPYDVYFPDYAEPNYPTIISGNTFTDDSTSIYLRLDKGHQSITVTGNDITEARNDAIRTWNVYDEDIVNPAINFNNMWNNEFGINNPVEEINLNATNNWWGAKDGPSGVGPGSGDAVSANVDYDPWLGAEPAEVKSETISGSGTMTDTAIGGQVTINGDGDHTITTAAYAENPGGACPFTNEGSYYDVHLDSADGVNSLTVQFCPALEGENISYWDGISWVAASNQIYSDGCIVVTITDDTQPSLADLTGTPFGQGFMPPVGGEAYMVSQVSLMLPWIALAVPIIAGVAIFIRRRRGQS